MFFCVLSIESKKNPPRNIQVLLCRHAVMQTIRLMYQLFDPDETYGMLKFNNTTP